MLQTRPLILVSPHTEREGSEFPDAAVSVSQRYSDAVVAAGGLPLIMPCTRDQGLVRDAVQRCAGVLLTGGEDVQPALYSPGLPEPVAKTVVPEEGERDLFELLLIDETFRQARPLLAICRGQQILNVALGGDLIADLPLQRPSSTGHNRQRERFQIVHEVTPEPGSLLATIAGTAPFGVNSTHHQAVGRVAPPLRVAGTSPDGVIEALEAEPRFSVLPFLLSVQFHPERLRDRYPIHAAIFASFVAACAESGPG
ncbi:MAG: gamma-glutamyl-gamma-aminobutyrate hydrolase family protein [Limisphaerales bacterium]